MRDETIVCIAPHRWDGLWKGTHAIMSQLARDNRVLYFEPGRDPERGVVAEMRRNWPAFFNRIMTEVRPGLFAIQCPPVLPHGRRHLPRALLRVTMPLVIAVNAGLLLRHVRQTLRALSVASPVLWLADPYHVPLVGRLHEKLVCYYNTDEFAHMADNQRVGGLLQRLDDNLTLRADVVLTTSRSQCDRRKALNPATHFVPNAVDLNLFVQAATRELPIPADLKPVPRPILGYVGWLTHHIDVALLHGIAEAYPHCSLVLLGPDELRPSSILDALRRQPNVVFLGRKDHTEIPAYLRLFDVALMPYAPIGHVPSAYPAKLHEYLAAGRAVVATDLPELRPYGHVVRLARTAKEFLGMIGDALRDRSAEAVERRLAVARENTWDRRVEQIQSIFDSALRGRPATV